MAGAIVFESFLELDRATIEAPGWLWGEVIQRQSFTVVHTGPKRGKSMLTMNVGIALAAGFPSFLDLTVSGPAKVVIFQREVHRFGMKERMQKMVQNAPLRVGGEALANISHNISRATRLHDLRTFADFRKLVRDERPDLIVLDPLAHVLVEDENDNAAVGRSLERIEELRDDPGSAVLVVHHNRKENESNRGVEPSQNARGADRIIADADAILSLVRARRHPLGPCSKIHLTARNSAGMEPFTAVFNKNTCWWERTYERGDVDKIGQWIDGAGGAVGRDELVRMIEAEWGLKDVQHRTAFRYIEKATEAGVIAAHGKAFVRATVGKKEKE